MLPENCSDSNLFPAHSAANIKLNVLNISSAGTELSTVSAIKESLKYNIYNEEREGEGGKVKL